MLQLQRYCGVALSRDMGSTMSVLSDGDAKTYNHLVDLHIYGDDCPVTLVGPGGVGLGGSPTVLSTSFAFGGNNCALIFSSPEEVRG